MGDDGFPKQPFGLGARIASGYAAGQVRDVDRIPIAGLLDDCRVLHRNSALPSLIRFRMLFQLRGGSSVPSLPTTPTCPAAPPCVSSGSRPAAAPTPTTPGRDDPIRRVRLEIRQARRPTADCAIHRNLSRGPSQPLLTPQPTRLAEPSHDRQPVAFSLATDNSGPISQEPEPDQRVSQRRIRRTTVQAQNRRTLRWNQPTIRWRQQVASGEKEPRTYAIIAPIHIKNGHKDPSLAPVALSAPGRLPGS